MRYLKNVATLRHDEEKCTNCGMCVVVCPHRVFAESGGKVRITGATFAWNAALAPGTVLTERLK